MGINTDTAMNSSKGTYSGIFGNPQQKQKFFQGIQQYGNAGQLGDWKNTHPGMSAIFDKLSMNPRFKTQFDQYNAVNQAIAGKNTAAGAAPTAAQGMGGTPADLIGNYKAPIPDIVNAYMQQLTKGGFLQQPNFQDMFNSYKDVTNRAADQQSANIAESYGSQGGRYSSDLLAAQGRSRADASLTLANKAQEYQSQLQQNQYQQVAGVANLEYGANEAAMSRLYQDFLRRTSPPPLFGTLQNQAANYGLPSTVLY